MAAALYEHAASLLLCKPAMLPASKQGELWKAALAASPLQQAL